MGWSLGSLTLSKLKRANEKRGHFWVASPFLRRLQAWVTCFGKMGLELDSMLPVCCVPGKTATYTVVLDSHDNPKK